MHFWAQSRFDVRGETARIDFSAEYKYPAIKSEAYYGDKVCSVAKAEEG
jgi:hypothetical protein